MGNVLFKNFKLSNISTYLNIILDFFCLLLIFLQIYIFEIDILSVIKFVFYFVVCIYSAGYLISRNLNNNNSSQTHSFSIAFGIGVNLIAYIISQTFHVDLIIIAITFITGAIGLFFLIKDLKISHYYEDKFKIDNSALIILKILLCITIITYSFSNPLPNKVGKISSWQDIVWNLGNTTAFSKGFPIRDMRILGVDFHYHYLSSMLKGIIHIATKIDHVLVMYVFSIFITIPFLVLSTDALGKYILENKKYQRLFIVSVFFLSSASSIFFDGNKYDYFINALFPHLIYAHNGMDHAVPLLILLTVLVLKTIKDNKLRIFRVLCISALTMMVTLAKGPLGMIFFLTMAVVIFCSKYQKKKIKNQIIITSVILLSFIIIYKLQLNVSGETGTKALRQPFEIVEGCQFYKKTFALIIDKISRVYPNKMLLKKIFLIIVVPIYFIGYLFFTSIPFIIVTIKNIFDFKNAKTEILLFLGIAWAGVIGGILLIFEGSSQLYFIMGGTVFIDVLGIYWLENRWPLLHKKYKIAIMITFLFAFASVINQCIPWLEKGTNNALIALNINKKDETTGYKNFTSGEYEGMQWIKKNTSKNSIIAVDRHFLYERPGEFQMLTNEKAWYFYYSAYSDRQMFLEGWGYTHKTEEMRRYLEERLKINDSFYKKENSQRYKTLKDNKIDYIVISNFIHPDLSFDDAGLELCFSNKDIKIYSVK